MPARPLLTLASSIFAATGLAYLLGPSAALAIVGIEGTATTEFLLRTESVPLLVGAVLLWLMRRGSWRNQRLALVTVAGYLAISSLIDLAAYASAVVGPASLPSAGIRLIAGAVFLASARRWARPSST